MNNFIPIILILVQIINFNLPAFSQSQGNKKFTPVMSNTIATQRSTQGGKKRAIVVSVSDYRHSAKNPEWHETFADKSLIKMIEVLVNRLGFEITNIEILTDKEFQFNNNGEKWKVCSESKKNDRSCKITALSPTSANIKKRFEEFLVNQTNPGDIALFYFMGHGQSIPDREDLNGKKDEADGCDETLVPIDYPNAKNPEKNIVDDEINDWATNLLSKSPKHVTFIFDSCQSGTANRGSEKNIIILGGNPLDPCKPENMPKDSAFDFGKTNSFSQNKENNIPTNFVFLSASHDNQNAVATEKVGGIFTAQLVEQLDRATPETTYQELMENVSNGINNLRNEDSRIGQIPKAQFSQDQKLFGGTVPPKSNFIAVKMDDKQRIILDAGRFHGTTKGSKFELYRREEGLSKRDEKKVIATATVTEVFDGKSVLNIDVDKGFSKFKSFPIVAYEIEHNFDSVLKISFDEKDKVKIANIEGGRDLLNLDTKDLAEIVDEKSGDWNIKIRYPFDCRGEKDKRCQDPDGFRGVVLQRKDGSIIAQIKERPNLSEEVKKTLRSESYFSILNSLSENNPKDNSINIKIRLYDVGHKTQKVPSSDKNDCSQFHGYSDEEIRKGEEVSRKSPIELSPGRCFFIELENMGEKDAYITVFNWTADNKIKRWFPYLNLLVEPLTFRQNGNLLKRGEKSFLYFKVQNTRIPMVVPVEDNSGNESKFEKIGIIATTKKTTDEFSTFFDTLKIGEKTQLEAGKRSSLSPLEKLLMNSQEGRRSSISIREDNKWGAFYLSFWIIPKKNN